MTIGKLTEESFSRVLYSHLSPSRPIKTIELLKGRDKEFRQMRQALASPGRHVFIYGDRGVGKTSLAQTAAVMHQSADGEPITLSCASPFFKIVEELAVSLSSSHDPTKKKSSKTSIRVGPAYAGVEHQIGRDEVPIPLITSINEAIRFTKTLLAHHSKAPVVVFDEFDLLPTEEDRRVCADFIKQISDQEIPLKMIFTGIGRSVTDLIKIHNSTARYLETIELGRLDHSARLKIISECAAALGVEVPRDTAVRISQVSDGFPHYVHLICEKMFWYLFGKPDEVVKVRGADYVEAVNQAAGAIAAFLKDAYNTATRKYSGSADYEAVLWAVTDSPMLERPSGEIFQSYKRILAAIAARDHAGDDAVKIALDNEEDLRRRFNSRINALKAKAHGEILVGTRTGWYEFRENIVRGYVRLRAEQEGVPLDVDHPLLKG